jgi:hypothetical protein
MDEQFLVILEEAFWEVTRHSYGSGKIIGTLKNSKDSDDILKYKYHLGKYFTYKYVRYMIQVVMGKIRRFTEFDEYMTDSEIGFARWCNALGITRTYSMEIMFIGIVDEYRIKYENINKRRFPEYAIIIKGKYDAFTDCHKVLFGIGVYEKSRTLSH